jgi:hypothetical protein
MSIFKKLGRLLASPSPKTERALYLNVQCNKCGEILRARVDLWNELTPDYDGKSDDPSSFHCRKVLVGENRCYQPIELRLKFDKNHKLVDQHITGGKFVDPDKSSH